MNLNKTSIASVGRLGLAFAAASVFVYAAGLPAIEGPVVFTKDIAPIMQQHCQNCHQPDAAAPMSLITYKDVRPWAKEIKRRTHVVRIFPNTASYLRLVRALAVETHEWLETSRYTPLSAEPETSRAR